MTDSPPLACTLDATGLEERLAAIAAVGERSLISHEREGDDHILRFQGGRKTRRRLEHILAAERKCCSFLTLSLSEQADNLVLSISAPRDAQPVADELSGAFEAAPATGRKRTRRLGVLAGAGGLALAACCIGLPLVVGVTIGATLGSVLDIAAGALVGAGVALVLYRRRAAKPKCC